MADLPDRFPDQHDNCMEIAKEYAHRLYRNSLSETHFEPEVFDEMQFALCVSFCAAMRTHCPDLPDNHCRMMFEEILDRVFRGNDDPFDED
jgi:hypothetical protein